MIAAFNQIIAHKTFLLIEPFVYGSKQEERPKTGMQRESALHNQQTVQSI